jgi:hypothetical protein
MIFRSAARRPCTPLLSANYGGSLMHFRRLSSITKTIGGAINYK